MRQFIQFWERALHVPRLHAHVLQCHSVALTHVLHHSDEPEVPSADAFRAHMRTKLAADLGLDSTSALPLREGFTPPTQEEKDMRARCGALLERVRNATAAFNDDLARGRDSTHGGVARRLGADAAAEATSRHHCEQVAGILEELRGEDAALCDAVSAPIAAALASLSPQLAKRFSPLPPPGGLIDIDLADLENHLNSTDAAAMYDHCIDKLTEFAAERADPAACASGEAIEDVDLFSLTPYDDGRPANGSSSSGSGSDDNDTATPSSAAKTMYVNAKWLKHLEQRQMGDSGRICRVTANGLEPEEAASSGGNNGDGSSPQAVKVQSPCVDCPRGGLVLDWVFGKIVNTAEKARTGAQTSLAGSPMAGVPGKTLRPDELRSAAESAYNALKRGCMEHAALVEQRQQAKTLLADVLRGRLAAEQAGVPALLAADASTPSGGQRGVTLTPALVSAALAQEDVLCAVKVLLLAGEAAAHQAAVRVAHAKVTRGHPEYRRLQAELEELDARSASGTAGNGGSLEHGAEAPSSSAVAASIAAERAQLMNQLAQRSSSLNALVESRDGSRAAEEAAQREVLRLETWRHTLKTLAADIAGDDAPARDAAMARVDSDVLRQLYSQETGRMLFDSLKQRAREWERKADRCAATLCHSEARLVNLCAIDPGAPIGAHLVLPALQESIFRAAELRAAATAEEAERAVAEEMSRQRAAKEAAEAAARRKRDAAAAKAAAARAKKLQQEGGSESTGVGSAGSALHDRASSPDDVQNRQTGDALANAKEKLIFAEKLAARRAAEDAALEARRQELMAQGGHWKERAEAAAAEAALINAVTEEEWRSARKLAAAAGDDVASVASSRRSGSGSGGTKTTQPQQNGSVASANGEHQNGHDKHGLTKPAQMPQSSSNGNVSAPPAATANGHAAPAAAPASQTPATTVAPVAPPPVASKAPAPAVSLSPLPLSAISAPPFQALTAVLPPAAAAPIALPMAPVAVALPPPVASGVVFQGAAAASLLALARTEVNAALLAARGAVSSVAAMPSGLRDVASQDVGIAVNALARAAAALALAQAPV